MCLPGRKYQATTSSQYRYSINGQEKESELNENITNAEYWEYDSRIGRRWNIDPKPNISQSPYSTFGNTPTLNIDAFGDTLSVGANLQSLDDIKSLAKNNNNRDCIKIDPKTNKLTLDFGNKTPDQIKSILGHDEGLNLLNDLSSSPLNYYYGAEDYTLAYNPSGLASLYYPDENTNPGDHNPSTILNHSNGGLNSRDESIKPIGFDGGVYIKPSASYTENNGSGDVVLNRANIVFHELAENFERTTNKVDYQNKPSNGNSGAHSRAISRERKFWGNGTTNLSSQNSTLLTRQTVLTIFNKVRIQMILINIENGNYKTVGVQNQLESYENSLWDY